MSGTAAAGRPAQRPRTLLTLVTAVSAMFMAQFDMFVVNIAAPTLRRELHAGDAALELVVGGYAFAFAAGLITGGRLGDRFGYRRVFAAGMAAFAATSLLCGLARTPGQLVGARLLQGLAGALMVPQVLSIVTVALPPEQRGRGTAWYGFASGLGSLAGQVLGGFLLQWDVFGLGWRALFLVNVPVGAVAIGAALRWLPRTAPRPTRFDGLGAAGVTAALALVLVPLTLGREEHWPVWTWLCLAAAVPVGAAVLAQQRALRRRGGAPVLEPALFRNRRYVRVLAAGALFQLYFGSFMFTLTLLLQQGLGRTPAQAALIFLPMGAAFSAGSLAGGRLVARYGRPVVRLGAAGVVVGVLALLVLVQLDGLPPAWPIGPITLIGLGNGLVLPPLIGFALREVRAEQAGAASGMVTTAQQFANALGIAMVGALFFALAGPAMAAVPAGTTGAAAVFAVLLLGVLALI